MYWPRRVVELPSPCELRASTLAWLMHPGYPLTLRGIMSNDMLFWAAIMLLASGMVLLVSLATIITDSARENEARVVPGAAPTVAAEQVAPPVRDPLADAGVVPADQSAPPSESQAGNAPALQP